VPGIRSPGIRLYTIYFLTISSRCHRCLAAEEALAAKYRTTLSGFERNCGFPTALRTGGKGFGFATSCGRSALALGLAGLAALWLVFEVLIPEEVLFPRCEYELCSAIDAF
jgi:hypothetical protein